MTTSPRWLETTAPEGTRLTFRARLTVTEAIVTGAIVTAAAVGVTYELLTGDLTGLLAALAALIVGALALYGAVATLVDATQLEVTTSHFAVRSGPMLRSERVLRTESIIAFRAVALAARARPWGGTREVFGVEIETTDGVVVGLPRSAVVEDAAQAALLCARLNELLRPGAPPEVLFNVVVPPEGMEWSEQLSPDGAELSVNRGELVFARGALVLPRGLLWFGASSIPLATIRYFRAFEEDDDGGSKPLVEVMHAQGPRRLPLSFKSVREAHFAAARLWQLTAARTGVR